MKEDENKNTRANSTRDFAANKRSKVEIYADIFEAIRFENAKFKHASPTRVANQAKLPYDRFQKILDQLIEKKMVHQMKAGLLLTEKGTKCPTQNLS